MIWIFDLRGLWPIRTNHLRGDRLWALDVVVSAEAFVTSATERRTPDWTGTPALVLWRLGLLTGRVHNVQVCNG